MYHNETLKRESIKDSIDSFANSRKLLPFLLVCLLFLSIIITLSASNSLINTQSGAYKNGMTLALSTAKSTVKPSEKFQVNVLIDTKTFSLSAADIKVSYPADQFEVTSITSSGFLPIVLSPGTARKGSASIVLGINPTQPKTGAAVLATLNVRAKGTGRGTFTFARTTQIAAVGFDQNVAGRMSGIQIKVQPR